MEVIAKITWKTVLFSSCFQVIFYLSDLDFELRDLFWLAKFFERNNVSIFILSFMKSPLFYDKLW